MDGDLNIILGKLLKILIIFIIINILVSLVGKLIDRGLKDRKITNIYSSTNRANTLGQILKKVIKYVLYFIWLITSLEMFDINTGSILATAGIGGLAIGFGAQSLVKDIITGFFILLEDQYAVGDHVKIDRYEGIVEELGLRVTKIRDFNGELHIMPNSTIQVVTNATRGAMRALVEISFSYEENVDRVMEVLEDVCNKIKDTNENVLDGPSILGITNLAEYDVKVTIVAKTKPMEHWNVERQIRKMVKEAFERENIVKAYPRRIVFGGEKQ
ncbi:mechanosensitive ion channel family protein [Tissierella creatinini]|nr:mechanosensitive ion channel family protein [Tissierella creatinini]TJX62245.1 mechanosensitive ion channel family protein [Soehngenia saccharolytica]